MSDTDTTDQPTDKHSEGLRAQIRGHGIDPATIDIEALAEATRGGAFVALDPDAPGGFRAETEAEQDARFERGAARQAERSPSFDQLDDLDEVHHLDEVDDQEPEA